MKAECTVPIKARRTIACLWCDHCRRHTEIVKKDLFEWIKGWDMDFSRDKTVYLEYYCDLLGKTISDPEDEDAANAPCKFKEWVQTNDEYELEYAQFRLTFKNGKMSATVLYHE